MSGLSWDFGMESRLSGVKSRFPGNLVYFRRQFSAQDSRYGSLLAYKRFMSGLRRFTRHARE